MSIESFLTRLRQQDATYWVKGAGDGFGGTAFGSPTAVKVFWATVEELVIDAEGKEKLSRAVAFTDQVIEEGSYMYLGTTTETDPTTLDDAREVITYVELPDVKHTTTVKAVKLT